MSVVDVDGPIEDPVLRMITEKYIFLKRKIAELESRRGTLSYEEVMELAKMKKMRLTTKKDLVYYKQHRAKI